ncbi:MAG: glycosyltransferase family 2 protein [Zoogloeaceae bacterium]|nr:glycosyltransferase family 2 protein [Zoogloeaceae bacterium]
MADGSCPALRAGQGEARRDNGGVPPASVAVLLAAHNRVATTLRCLEDLQFLALDGLGLEIFLVDDGSSDGTGPQVAARFPKVHLFVGDGSLYWGGGMRLVFGEALARGFDFYLLLNDDTHLHPHALEAMVRAGNAALESLGRPAIVVGSVADPEGGGLSYGGWVARRGGLWPLSWPSWEKAAPDPVQWRECATMNGNCVLIPAAVAERVGNLDPTFRHVGGDLDYGLRARQAGFPVVIAPGFVGVCALNRGLPPWRDRRRSLVQRWSALRGPKGFPVAGWAAFVRRHKGPLWVIPWALPYLAFWLREVGLLLRGRP